MVKRVSFGEKFHNVWAGQRETGSFVLETSDLLLEGHHYSEFRSE